MPCRGRQSVVMRRLLGGPNGPLFVAVDVRRIGSRPLGLDRPKQTPFPRLPQVDRLASLTACGNGCNNYLRATSRKVVTFVLRVAFCLAAEPNLQRPCELRRMLTARSTLPKSNARE